MRLEKKTGGTRPEAVQYSIKLGLRQYTVAFGVTEESMDDSGNSQAQYSWHEATFGLGKPTYAQLTAAIIQSRYPQDDMQAIINNHLLDDGNEEHEAEFQAMQQWRTEAKTLAKDFLAAMK